MRQERAFLLLLPATAVAAFPFFSDFTTPKLLIAGIILGIWLLRQRPAHGIGGPGGLLLAGYLVASIPAWLASAHPHDALLAFVLDLACVALYWGMRRPGTRRAVTDGLAPWLAAAGLCVAVFFALGRLPGVSFFSIGTLADSSTMGNPDFVAEYLACVAPAGLAIAGLGIGAWRARRGAYGAGWAVAGSVLPAAAATILVLIPSLTGRLAAAAGVATFVVLSVLRRSRWPRPTAVIGAAVAVFIVAGAWLGVRQADEGRSFLYEVSVDAALDRPLVGQGIGGFARTWLGAQGERLQEDRTARKWWTNARHAHNQPLQVWVERGLLAMLLLAAFWVYHLWLAIRMGMAGNAIPASVMAAALVCSLGSVTYDQVPFRMLLFLLAGTAGDGPSILPPLSRMPRAWMAAARVLAVAAGIALLVLPPWHALADFHFVRGNFQTACRLEPANGRSLYYLGVEKMRAGDSREAARLLELAAKLRPNLNGLITLGNVLTRAHRLDEAEAPYLQAIAWKPDFAPAFANLAVLYHRKGQPETAWRYALRAVSLRPSDPDYRRIHKEVCRDNPHCTK